MVQRLPAGWARLLERDGPINVTIPAFGGRGCRRAERLELVGFSSIKGLMQETPSSNSYLGRIENRPISQLRRNVEMKTWIGQDVGDQTSNPW